MTSILTSISGQFSKALILGTLLPVAVFVFLAQLFIVPLLPFSITLLGLTQNLTAQDIIVTSIFTIVLSGLLYNLNIPIIRFYEGYSWRSSRLGNCRIDHYKQKLDTLRARHRGMSTLLFNLDENNNNYERIKGEWNAIGRQLNNEFPTVSSVLPTRLGNVIRSFEDYPYRQYRISAITLWPRLVAKIDKDYAIVIEDAKTSFDFMINSSVLSMLFAIIVLFLGMFYGIPFNSWQAVLLWVIEIIGFGGLSYLFYLSSIGRAAAWGDTVKSAFDLYKGGLLEQLGYKQPVMTRQQERTLWSNISLQIIYGDARNGPRIDYALEDSPILSTFLSGEPSEVPLELTKGIQRSRFVGGIMVVIQVHNADLQQRTVQNVVVTDTLPEGFEYQWNSASLDSNVVSVMGTNPYQFRIGELKAGQSITLMYRAIPRKP